MAAGRTNSTAVPMEVVRKRFADRLELAARMGTQTRVPIKGH